MSEFVRRELPLVLIFLFGISMMIPFFWPNPTLDMLKAELGSWAVLIRNVTVFLGLIYMSFSQWRSLQRDKSLSGYISFIAPYLALVLFIGTALAFPGQINSPQYQWLYQNIYRAQVSMYVSLPLFYCYSAAYRAFTVRSIEAFALMLGGMIYTLRQIPLFTYLFPALLPMGEWVMLVPNVGGGRGAVIAVGLAAIVVGLRTLAGREVTTIEVR
jgi:hypothetical protein